jgi:hypothetical protein
MAEMAPERRCKSERARYVDCVLVGGMTVVVFHDAVQGGWLEQKA